jgi:tetratricopeptide (TPR) repeat protein
MVASPTRQAKHKSVFEHLLQSIDGFLLRVPFLGAPSQIRAGRRAFALKDWPTAAEHYKLALDAAPNNPTAWVQYGHALKEKGDRPEAEKAYYESLKLRPDFADTYVQLGHVTKLMGRLEEAAAHYQRALKLKPDRADVVRELEWLDAQFIGLLASDLFKSSPDTGIRNPARGRRAAQL